MHTMTDLTERKMNQQDKVIKAISMGKLRQVYFVLQGYLCQKKLSKTTVDVEYITTQNHQVSIANTKFQRA